MPDRTICLTDQEATIAAQGKLGAILRVMKPQPPEHHWSSIPGYKEWFVMLACTDGYWGRMYRSIPQNPEWNADFKVCSPFPAPGQRLGLKETWALTNLGSVYKASYTGLLCEADHWRSPVTIPARFIRHHPTVQEVRAVQVKDICILSYPAFGIDTGPYLLESTVSRKRLHQLMDMWRIPTPETWVWFARLEGEAHHA